MIEKWFSFIIVLCFNRVVFVVEFLTKKQHQSAFLVPIWKVLGISSHFPKKMLPFTKSIFLMRNVYGRKRKSNFTTEFFKENGISQ